MDMKNILEAMDLKTIIKQWKIYLKMKTSYRGKYTT